MRQPIHTGLIQRCALEWTKRDCGSRYPSDLTDQEWALVQAAIPVVKPGNQYGDMRAIVNGITYILTTRCSWNAIPKDLPPRTTLYDYINNWSRDGTLKRIQQILYMKP